MFKKYFLVLSVVLLASYSNAFAATQNYGKKQAIVDMQIVESGAEVVISSVQKLMEKQEKYKVEFQKKLEDVQNRGREMESKKGILSVAAIEQKRKDLEREFMELQNEAQMKGELIQKVRGDVLAEIDALIREQVALVAGKKYDAVIAKQFLLFFSDEVYEDITNEVLKGLNSKHKTLNVDKFFVDDAVAAAGAKGSKHQAKSKKAVK